MSIDHHLLDGEVYKTKLKWIIKLKTLRKERRQTYFIVHISSYKRQIVTEPSTHTQTKTKTHSCGMWMNSQVCTMVSSTEQSIKQHTIKTQPHTYKYTYEENEGKHTHTLYSHTHVVQYLIERKKER